MSFPPAFRVRVSTSPYKYIFYLIHLAASTVQSYCVSMIILVFMLTVYPCPSQELWNGHNWWPTAFIVFSTFPGDLLYCLGIQSFLTQPMSLNGLMLKGLSHNFFLWLVLEWSMGPNHTDRAQRASARYFQGGSLLVLSICKSPLPWKWKEKVSWQLSCHYEEKSL